jgi:hypothetical protein
MRLSNIESLKSSFIWLICKNKTFKLFFEYSLVFIFGTYAIKTSKNESMSNWLSLSLDITSRVEIDEFVFDVKGV